MRQYRLFRVVGFRVLNESYEESHDESCDESPDESLENVLPHNDWTMLSI